MLRFSDFFELIHPLLALLLNIWGNNLTIIFTITRLNFMYSTIDMQLVEFSKTVSNRVVWVFVKCLCSYRVMFSHGRLFEIVVSNNSVGLFFQKQFWKSIHYRLANLLIAGYSKNHLAIFIIILIWAEWFPLSVHRLELRSYVHRKKSSKNSPVCKSCIHLT